MKFAKYLQDETIPEWRKAYMNYKQGKKHLKAIERAFERAIEQRESALNAPTQDPFALSHQQTAATDSTLSEPATNKRSNSLRTHQPNHQDLDQDTDSPSGATPIFSKGRDRNRSYSSINIPSANASNQPSLKVDDDLSVYSAVTEVDGNAASGSEAPVTKTPQRASTMCNNMRKNSQVFKALTRRFTMANLPEHTRHPRRIIVENNDLETVRSQLMPEEKAFFDFLDDQLEMVDTFYKEKELEAVTKLKVIKQQLYVANEWKRRYDVRKAKADAESRWYEAEWSRMRNGIGNLMRADTTLTEDVVIGPLDSDPPHVGAHPRSQACGFSTSSGQGSAGLRHRGNAKPGVDPAVRQEQMIQEDEEDRRQHLNHKVARTRIKTALSEFYRSLEMLKNYKALNSTGFAKIMKKFDKTAGWKASKAFEHSKLLPRYFMTSTLLKDLTVETEDLYINSFEQGHRRRGMAKLRIPDSKNQTHHNTAIRVGIYMGLALPLMVQGLQSAFSKETQADIPYWDSLLLVYAGLFLTILFGCLFGLNMKVWYKNKINYKFIFEFDPRDNLDYHEFFEIPVFFMLLLSMALYFDFGSRWTHHVATAYWPLILMSLVTFILLCPLPVFNYGARKWFLTSCWRIVASGFKSVEFRDFFIADEMNSLSYSIEQFEFAICAYVHHWDDLPLYCKTSQMWITPFVTALPPWFRFMQCIRRFKDTAEWFPHLVNAGKYTSSLVTLFVYFAFRHYGGNALKAAYIFMAIVSSTYTFVWDVYMDWGLFRFGKYGGAAYGHPFLRPELVYSKEWVYYMAIVLDFVGRFAWVVRFMPLNVDVMILSFSLALVEVLRRWQWNFFRLENEHLNNCGQFRAIKDIPLPFHIHYEDDTSEPEEFDEEDGKQGQGDAGTMDDQGVKVVPLDRKSSRASFKSSSGGQGTAHGGGDRQISVPSNNRRGSLAPPPEHPSVGRSNTFVDAAMAEAGFNESQREEMQRQTDAVANKFFNRRDFDTKMDDDEFLLRTSPRGRSRTRTGLGAPANAMGPSPVGLGLNMEGDDGISTFDLPATATPRQKTNIGARLFKRRDDSDDDFDYDTD
ncbi:hypothetical protein BG006_011100 [Podila minutissima]|uniref:Uncharacterized protein n=1 Tax=Podila minutissima TaxID=64525 RepID=A0A9P5SCG1_9FUNG|nr:hypothetical protein BG006_011100 [Podila minutissima]